MLTRKIIYTTIFYSLLFLHISAQNLIPLYENGVVPGAIQSNVLYDTIQARSWVTGKDTIIIRHRTIMPTLAVFSPLSEYHSRLTVIICSGGSYRNVADSQEGIPVAQKLASEGITAFVLHYRVPRNDLMVNKSTAPMQDLQKAIKYVREHADSFHIDKNKLGIMGFSAGGHLVSTVATHPDSVYISNVNNTDLKPDFMVLVYPVISFADSLTHQLSRYNLIGPNYSPDQIINYSNELQVNFKTPSTFITHAIDDDVVKVENSLYFYAALQQANVSSEIFLYKQGGHGFGILNSTAKVQWIDNCIGWMKNGAWRRKNN